MIKKVLLLFSCEFWVLVRVWTRYMWWCRERALFSVINIMIIYDFHKNAEIYEISYEFRSIVCFLFSSLVAELSSSHFSALRRSFFSAFSPTLTHSLLFFACLFICTVFISSHIIFSFRANFSSTRYEPVDAVCEGENHVKMKKNQGEKVDSVGLWSPSEKKVGEGERTTEMKTFSSLHPFLFWKMSFHVSVSCFHL